MFVSSSVQLHYGMSSFCRDGAGLTPFMLAVSVRAYTAALQIFGTIKKIVENKSQDPSEREMVSINSKTTD